MQSTRDRLVIDLHNGYSNFPFIYWRKEFLGSAVVAAAYRIYLFARGEKALTDGRNILQLLLPPLCHHHRVSLLSTATAKVEQNTHIGD